MATTCTIYSDDQVWYEFEYPDEEAEEIETHCTTDEEMVRTINSDTKSIVERCSESERKININLNEYFGQVRNQIDDPAPWMSYYDKLHYLARKARKGVGDDEFVRKLNKYMDSQRRIKNELQKKDHLAQMNTQPSDKVNCPTMKPVITKSLIDSQLEATDYIIRNSMDADEITKSLKLERELQGGVKLA